jgi:glucosylceramidase
MHNKHIKWISTTKDNRWEDRNLAYTVETDDFLEMTGEKYQHIGGFGGCFNELGWIVLSKLDEEKRKKVLSELFNPVTGCKFNFCRLPMGASDYASEWYSYNDHDGDYMMEKFSIERDRLFLLPYIKESMNIRHDLKFFASPWSPPVWMKSPKVYNYGRLRMEKEILNAYALYFKKYIEAYRAEGIDINQIHIQNEPFADQKFPSCLWSGEQFRVFIRDYLGPLFERENISTEIWFGTLNGPAGTVYNANGLKVQDYDSYIDHVLFDKKVRKYIKGLGFQWAGKQAIQRAHDSFPELMLMQTENECGDGLNTWEYAQYVFNLIRHYFVNGANSYIYWNMVLEPNGISTWGWNQNSLITIEPDSKAVKYNPEFYVMKHFSHFVSEGAVRIGTKGHWSGASLAFENPNGDIAVIVSNALNRPRNFSFSSRDETFTVTLKPDSFNTFLLHGN